MSEAKEFKNMKELYDFIPGLDKILESIESNLEPVKLLLFEVYTSEVYTLNMGQKSTARMLSEKHLGKDTEYNNTAQDKLFLNLVKVISGNTKADYLKLLGVMSSLEFKSNKAIVIDIDLLMGFQFEKKNISKAN